MEKIGIAYIKDLDMYTAQGFFVSYCDNVIGSIIVEKNINLTDIKKRLITQHGYPNTIVLQKTNILQWREYPSGMGEILLGDKKPYIHRFN